MDTQSQSSFFDNVSIYFDQAASFTEYPKGLLHQIKVCNSIPSSFLLSAPSTK
jgi:glutamate dehydrogenase (NAD(P)+)